MRLYAFLWCLLSFFFSCSDSKPAKVESVAVKIYSGRKEIKDWHFDSPTDSVAGIGLDSAIAFVKNKKQKKEVVIALIDGVVDVRHEDLAGSIYTNKNEIDGNGKDDDENGYVDDIHGWNFLGKKDGTSLSYGVYDHVAELKRMSKKYGLDEDYDSSVIRDSTEKAKFDSLMVENKGSKEYGQILIDWAENHRDNYFKLHKYFPQALYGEDFSLKQWDSIKEQTSDEEIKSVIDTWKYFKEYDITITAMNHTIERSYAMRYQSTNIELDPYSQIDDNPNELMDTSYGHGFIGQFPERSNHGTQVAGIMVAQSNNGIGVRGVAPKAKLMVLEIMPSFNDRIKDFANAVRYAADNGADIINYSISKGFMFNSEAFYGAIKYATEKGVLFVCSAGNRGLNNDVEENISHPVVDPDMIGFMKIGATTRYTDERLVPGLSSYGKNTVDVFAPGIDIMTTDVYENDYLLSFGTSISSAVVSGLAAFIWSYYPELTLEEIEMVLKESGTAYDVNIETKEGSKNFSELSESGKVVNAYNAILLAEKITSEKSKP